MTETWERQKGEETGEKEGQRETWDIQRRDKRDKREYRQRDGGDIYTDTEAYWHVCIYIHSNDNIYGIYRHVYIYI